MTQTQSWALQHVFLLSKHHEEQKRLLGLHEHTMSLLRTKHQQELDHLENTGLMDEFTQVSLLIEQTKEKQILINSFAEVRSAMQQYHQQEEQAMLRQIEQEKVRQN